MQILVTLLTEDSEEVYFVLIDLTSLHMSANDTLYGFVLSGVMMPSIQNDEVALKLATTGKE